MALDQAFFDAIRLEVVKKKYYNAGKVNALLDEIRRQAAKTNGENEILRRQLFSLIGQKTEIGETLLSAKSIAQQIILDAEKQAAEIVARAEERSRELSAENEAREKALQDRVDAADRKLRKRMMACLDELGDDLRAILEPEAEVPAAPPKDVAEKVDAIAREVYAMESGE